MESFVSIDFETANISYDSICQIGIVEFEDDQIKKEWNIYINPETWFDSMNISIHGITPEMVADKPTFKDIFPELVNIVKDKILVHHTHFEKTALSQICDRYDLDANIPVTWLDSALIVKRTWEQFRKSGYGLSSVGNFLNIQFKHHHATEDARAAGLVVLAAKKESGIDISEWINRVKQPVTPRIRNQSSSYSSEYRAEIGRDGDPEGEFFGETIVFSGNFYLPKKELSCIASIKGCNVENDFTSRTTILVVGNQNPKALKGKEKSNKQLAAEKRILRGEDVRILTESDFVKIFE